MSAKASRTARTPSETTLGTKSGIAAARGQGGAQRGVRSLSVELPLPGRDLSPNGRLTPFAKARAVRSQKELAMGAFVNALNRRPVPVWTAVKATAVFYYPTRQRADDDNAMASMKGARDQIAAMLGIDDKNWHWERPVFLVDRGRPGRVTVTIEPVEEGDD
jgi:hypothetical protein